MAKNVISASKYDIYNKYLAIGEKYFGANKDYLSFGAIGYWTELMASNLRDSAIHKTMIYNENFLNTAIMPKSIYNWAKMFNVNVSTAKPSKAYIKITLSEEDFTNYAINYSTNQESFINNYGSDISAISDAHSVVVISKENVIQAGEFPFLLEHSILLYSTAQGSYKARYCLTEGKLEKNTTNFGDYLDPYINVRVLKTEDEDRYLELSVIAYQYRVNQYKKRIASSSFLDTRLHKFEFNDQLAGCILYKKENTLTKEVTLLFSDMPVDENKYDNVAFYNLIDDNLLQIKFKGTTVSPVPQTGTILDMYIFETKGTAGNIFYAEDIIINLKNEDYKNLSIIANFEAKSTGGLDKSSLEDIKNIIIKELSTRSTIISLSDLNSYFGSLATQIKEVNNSNITFIKKRDDIIKRTFTAYLLLRDGIMGVDENGKPIFAPSAYPSKVIPTNTVDLQYSLQNTTENAIVLNSTFQIQENNNVFSVNNSPTPSDAAISNTYFLPFEAHVYLNGYRQVKYYFVNTNNSTALITNSIKGESDYYIIPIDINVKRPFTTDSASDKYIFTARVRSNMTESQISGCDFKVGFSDISEAETDISDITITTESGEDANEKFYLIKFYAKPHCEENATSSIIFDTLTSKSNLKLEIGSNTTSINENNIVKLKISSSVLDYDAEFRSYEKINFFYSLSAIMSSDVQVTQIGTGSTATYTVTIKDVPIINKSFLTSWNGLSAEDLHNTLTSQLFSYIKIIKEALTKLENNTFIDLKFRNTYGISKFYNCEKTNIRLGLKIYLKNAAGINENGELENEIRDYIRVQVDLANHITETVDADSDVGELNISEIIALTTSAYSDYISRIDFISLNGTFNQHISKIYNEEDHPELVLEYFNLDSTTLEDDIVFEEID